MWIVRNALCTLNCALVGIVGIIQGIKLSVHFPVLTIHFSQCNVQCKLCDVYNEVWSMQCTSPGLVTRDLTSSWSDRHLSRTHGPITAIEVKLDSGGDIQQMRAKWVYSWVAQWPPVFRYGLGWLEAGGLDLRWGHHREADPGGGGEGHRSDRTVPWLQRLNPLPGGDHLQWQEVAAGTPEGGLQPACFPSSGREALPPVRQPDIQGVCPLLPLDLWLRGGENSGWQPVIWPLACYSLTIYWH